MKVAIALIHYKAVTPTHLVVNMCPDAWHKFLHASQRVRQEMIVPKLKPHLGGKVRELVWIPLDGQNKLQIVDNNSVLILEL